MFLRGPDSGNVVQGFCTTCHKAEAYARFYPHLMLTSEGQIIEGKCLICHTRLLSRAMHIRTPNPALRDEQVALCQTCHPTHKQYSPVEHIGLHVAPEMLARLGPDVRLAPDRRIVCTTCHSPHQEGLFTQPTVLGQRTMRLVAPDRVRTPTRDDRPCGKCHEQAGASR